MHVLKHPSVIECTLFGVGGPGGLGEAVCPAEVEHPMMMAMSTTHNAMRAILQRREPIIKLMLSFCQSL
jgi:hypothetical protein